MLPSHTLSTKQLAIIFAKQPQVGDSSFSWGSGSVRQFLMTPMAFPIRHTPARYLPVSCLPEKATPGHWAGNPDKVSWSTTFKLAKSMSMAGCHFGYHVSALLEIWHKLHPTVRTVYPMFVLSNMSARGNPQLCLLRWMLPPCKIHVLTSSIALNSSILFAASKKMGQSVFSPYLLLSPNNSERGEWSSKLTRVLSTSGRWGNETETSHWMLPAPLEK